MESISIKLFEDGILIENKYSQATRTVGPICTCLGFVPRQMLTGDSGHVGFIEKRK
jgi:hypothetical protein